MGAGTNISIFSYRSAIRSRDVRNYSLKLIRLLIQLPLGFQDFHCSCSRFQAHISSLSCIHSLIPALSGWPPHLHLLPTLLYWASAQCIQLHSTTAAFNNREPLLCFLILALPLSSPLCKLETCSCQKPGALPDTSITFIFTPPRFYFQIYFNLFTSCHYYPYHFSLNHCYLLPGLLQQFFLLHHLYANPTSPFFIQPEWLS